MRTSASMTDSTRGSGSRARRAVVAAANGTRTRRLITKRSDAAPAASAGKGGAAASGDAAGEGPSTTSG